MENICHKFHAEVLIIEKNMKNRFTYNSVRTIVSCISTRQGSKLLVRKQIIAEDYMWPVIDEVDRKYNNSNNNIQLKD